MEPKYINSLLDTMSITSEVEKKVLNRLSTENCKKINEISFNTRKDAKKFESLFTYILDDLNCFFNGNKKYHHLLIHNKSGFSLKYQELTKIGAITSTFDEWVYKNSANKYVAVIPSPWLIITGEEDCVLHHLGEKLMDFILEQKNTDSLKFFEEYIQPVVNFSLTTIKHCNKRQKIMSEDGQLAEIKPVVFNNFYLS